MDLTIFLAVLFAAALHATWNALVKGNSDKILGMTAVVLGHVPFALLAMPFVPLPAMASWPYLAAGVALHLGYQLFLMFSYRIGDLTQVYPIARGSAPLIVAGVSIAFLGVQLSSSSLVAIAIIGCGIMSLVFVRNSDGLANPRAAAMALATGCFIASYSLCDGLGARQAGTAVGYYAWLTLFNAVLFALIIRVTKPGTLSQLPSSGRMIALIGGGASFLAYAIVTWAFTMAPIALVTALRETSIVFALIIGVVFLKEPLNLAKVASTMATLLGVTILKGVR
ncbi:hypothetical protein MnTg02_00375 [bacterium MnTg02]|nr:hypothetical protein MnTg02_00375 [bacterium MnTg02]